MLRAIGTTRRQVREMIRYESIITALIGGVLGIALGIVLALILAATALSGSGFVLVIPVSTMIVLFVARAAARRARRRGVAGAPRRDASTSCARAGDRVAVKQTHEKLPAASAACSALAVLPTGIEWRRWRAMRRADLARRASATGPGPGAGPAVELGPAPWVPALPLRDRAAGGRCRCASARRARRRRCRDRCGWRGSSSCSRSAAATFVLEQRHRAAAAARDRRQRRWRRHASLRADAPIRSPPRARSPATRPRDSRTRAARRPGAARCPRRSPVSSDAAGSTIASITSPSHALGWRDSYLVYLPPGYRAQRARAATRSSTCCTATTQPARSFLRLGLQRDARPPDPRATRSRR